MKDVKIMTTGAGAPGAKGIFHGLKDGFKSEKRRLTIITSDMDKDAYGFHLADMHYIIPEANDDDFINTLLEIAKKEKPDILFSWVTPELVPISKAKEEFDDLGVKIALSEWKNIECAQNKIELYKKFGIYAPDFRIVKNVNQFEKSVYELGYPVNTVCFKPSVSYGSRGFRILDPNTDRSDLLFKFKPNTTYARFEDILHVLKEYEKKKGRIRELIVMKYIEANEYSVDLLLSKGESIVTIPRQRARIKQGISNIARLEKNEILIEAAEKIGKKLKLDFNTNMQFFLKDEKPILIEVQPRLSGTIVACMGAGANMPYLAAKMVLGEKLPKIDIRWNTVMKRFWDEIFIYD